MEFIIRHFFLILLFCIYGFSSQISLTKEERAYLDQKPYITVSNLNNFQPFNFTQNGEAKGYSVDFVKHIGNMINKDIKFVNQSMGDLFKDFKNSKLDLVPHFAVMENRKDYAIYTNFDHITFMIGFAIRKDSDIDSMSKLKGKKIAIVESYFIEDHLKNNFPDIDIVTVPSTKEAMKALVNNEVSAVIDNMPTLNYFIQKNWLTNIKIKLIDDLGLPLERHLPMAVSKENRVLKSILEKANDAISKEKRDELKRKWFYDDSVVLDLNKQEVEYLNSKESIKVANLPTLAPFNFNENNTPKGFSIDYMDLFGKYLEKNIEFVSGKSWNEYLGMLSKGELDVIPHIAITKGREQNISYTDFNHIEHLLGVATNKDNTILSIDDLKDKVLAVVNGTFIHSYLKNNYPKTSLFVTSSTVKALEVVSSGKADAVIGNMPSLNYYIHKNWLSNLKVGKISGLEEIEKIELPMGVKKDNLVLKSILEKVNRSIPPYEIDRLRQKWINLNIVQRNNSLTSEERAYLKEKKVIKICVLPNWLPYEQIDEEGKHKGIGNDLMIRISKYIDTPIELIPTKEWGESLQNIRDRKCDILPVAMELPSRKDSMNFTKPYLKEPFVIATKLDELFVKDSNAIGSRKVGIVKNYAFKEVLKRRNPNVEIIDVEDAKDGLEKVRSGELFGYVDVMSAIGYTMQKNSIYDLKIAGKLEFNVDLSIASRNDEPLLNSIMQKGLNSLSENEIRTIYGKWVSIKVSQDIDYTLFWQLSALFIVILLLVLYRNRSVSLINRKLKRAHLELQEQQKMVDRYVIILTTDTEGVIIDANHAYCKALGYDKTELIGNDHSLIRHPDMPEDVFEQMWLTIKKNRPWQGEVKNLRKDKKDIWFSMNIEPIIKYGVKLGYRAICEDITDKKRIEELSITDKLTGLYNRLRLDEILNMKEKEFKRYKIVFSVIILDIDNFKSVNDIYGHNVGDYVLQTLSNILKNNIRETDFLGRWGGEEFVIVCENTNLEGAYTLAESLRKKVEDTEFETVGHKTISLGVAEFKEDDTISGIFKRVDDALYAAKRSGKNKAIKSEQKSW